MSTLGVEPEPPARLRLVRVSIPLVRAHRAATGAEVRREVVLVGWVGGDGTVGWGECPTLEGSGYVTEPTATAWRALVEDLGPAVLRGGPLPTPVEGLLAAPSALADARLDHDLRRAGTSLRDHLGGRSGTVPRCEVLADLGGDPVALAARAEAAVERGAELVKVKVAPGSDVEQLGAVVAAVGAGSVAADANGTYRSVDEARGLDRLGLRYLEQPFAPSLGADELAARHAALDTPVALDESLTSLREVEQALAVGHLAAVSVKPSRLGGVQTAARVVATASEAGVAAFVGGMLELGIGRAAAAAVASLPGCTWPTDLGPSDHYVAEDVCDAVVVDERGRLVVPEGPGVGRTPDEHALERWSVEEVRLEV